VEEHLPAVERAFHADFTQEGERYRCRDAIAALLAPWFAARTLEEIRIELDEHGVCWGPYQSFTQLLEEDWRASTKNPVFGTVDHPGIGELLTPASPVRVPNDPPVPPAPAPLLGTHTDEVLEDVLGLSPAEIGALHDAGLVAGPDVP
jgi:2-methylfumaryl-CoA isomerase